MGNTHWPTIGEQLSADGRKLVQTIFPGASGSVASAMNARAMNIAESGEDIQSKTLADVLNEWEEARGVQVTSLSHLE